MTITDRFYNYILTTFCKKVGALSFESVTVIRQVDVVINPKN